jgi:hypothetical protein
MLVLVDSRFPAAQLQHHGVVPGDKRMPNVARTMRGNCGCLGPALAERRLRLYFPFGEGFTVN